MSARLRVLLLLAASLAAANASAQEPSVGAQLFKQKCTTCHGANRAVDGARKIAPADRTAQLEQFLTAHFCRDADERKAIVEYLVAEASK